MSNLIAFIKYYLFSVISIFSITCLAHVHVFQWEQWFFDDAWIIFMQWILVSGSGFLH